jgi:HSP20 family molecular chaperone IbpA
MAGQRIGLKKTESILDELNRMHDDISRRAYDLFQQQGLFSGALDDWLRAERELVWRPAVELRQKGAKIELLAAIAGVEAKDLDVQVTPEDILITAKTEHHHDTKEETVHVSEFKEGRLFRSVHLPARIDPDSVKADYRNGLLRLTAAVAKVTPRKVDVQAA